MCHTIRSKGFFLSFFSVVVGVCLLVLYIQSFGFSVVRVCIIFLLFSIHSIVLLFVLYIFVFILYFQVYKVSVADRRMYTYLYLYIHICSIGLSPLHLRFMFLLFHPFGVVNIYAF